MDEATEEALKAQHGEVYTISAAGFDIMVRVPTGPECERWRDTTAADKKRGAKALEMLVRECVVHPSKADYDAIVMKRPLLPMTLGEEVLKLAGATNEVSVKKA